MSVLVSVVIPTYNRAGDLKRAVTSVVSQTWQNWELWVVDNHSTDRTAQVVADFRDPRIRLLFTHNDGVIAVSRNLGAAYARGEYLAFLDSDDWWLPRKLERSVAVLESGADVVYHDLYCAKSPSTRWSLRHAVTFPLSSPVYTDLLERGNALNNSSVVVRRHVLQAVGGLSEDPRIASWEDYDCWLRVARITEKFCRIPETLGYYWVGGGNVSSPERTIRNLSYVRDTYFAPSGRQEDSQLPAWYHYSLGIAYYQLGRHSAALRHLPYALSTRLRPVTRTKAAFTAALLWCRFGRQRGLGH